MREETSTIWYGVIQNQKSKIDSDTLIAASRIEDRIED